ALFKDMAGEGLVEPPGSGKVPTFKPEYEGMGAISTSVRTAARFRHGTVVRVLRTALVRAGLEAYNDQQRDLYIPAVGGSPGALFEAKTSADSQSLYTAVGQLTMHAEPSGAEVRIAVLPESCSSQQRVRLENRGIQVLPYVWEAGQPVFSDLGALIADLGPA
ncbi:MAG: hypothetical protein HN750_17085, partial [Gemmatimonadales bacterium]|nr:hypothetical protein [Gemmatimonadales bacterium]